MSVAIWTETEFFWQVHSILAFYSVSIFQMFANIEQQKLEERIRYIASLDQVFRHISQTSSQRQERYVPDVQTSADFIRPDDSFLHLLASFVKVNLKFTVHI